MTNNRPLIYILMATYNGEKYIKEQIDSILDQNYTKWKLVIHDDNSNDNTIKIIKNYQKRYPNKISLIEDGIKCGSAKKNFSHLLTLINNKDFDYIMFCDQDDVWLKHKIKNSLTTIQHVENSIGINLPILLHTDLKVVDNNLKLISDSFWKYQKLNPNIKEFNRLLIQNNVTGCTIMLNRSLYTMSIPIPEYCVMHDWWLVLVASAFGKILHHSDPTVLYRQHINNVIGAKKVSINYILYALQNRKRIISDFKNFFVQAMAFKKKYRDYLTIKQIEILNSFLSLTEVDIFSKFRIIFNCNFFAQNIIRNLGYFYLITKIN